MTSAKGPAELLRVVAAAVPPEDFELWLKGLPVEERGGALRLLAPNDFHRDWVTKHYGEALTSAAHSLEATGLEVVSAGEASRGEAVAQVVERSRAPTMTFDNFVAGRSNATALASAVSFAREAERGTAVAFFYGPSGCGKTHLLAAIGERARETDPSLRVVFTSAEAMFSGLVDALKRGALHAAKRRLRSADLLLVDDVGFASGKTFLQNELLGGMDEVVRRGGRVAFACSRSPQSLGNVDKRLLSRFRWGILSKVSPPDASARAELLSRLCAGHNLVLPDPIREMIEGREGISMALLSASVVRLAAAKGVLGRTPPLAVVSALLGDILQTSALCVDDVVARVSERFGVSEHAVRGRARAENVRRARAVCALVAREVLSLSLAEIGAALSGRRHSTVLSAINHAKGHPELASVAREVAASLGVGNAGTAG